MKRMPWPALFVMAITWGMINAWWNRHLFAWLGVTLLTLGVLSLASFLRGFMIRLGRRMRQR